MIVRLQELIRQKNLSKRTNNGMIPNFISDPHWSNLDNSSASSSLLNENRNTVVHYPTHDLEHYLNEKFGFQNFRPLQREIITEALKGRDIFVVLATGAGKSLCYELPAVIVDGITIVISPLISLIQDQVAALKQFGICASYLVGNQHQTEEMRKIVIDDLKSEKRKTKLLYVTPEKIEMCGAFRDLMMELHCLGKISRVVIDEAHLISEWGAGFRPSYRKIKTGLLDLFVKNPVPIMALTATATEQVQSDLITEIGMKNVFRFNGDLNRPNLVFEVHVKTKDVIQDISSFIDSHGYRNQCGIIYCLTKTDADKICQNMVKLQHKCEVYHANVDDKFGRHERWIRDKNHIMIATTAFGMGIDKSDVRFVIHHTFPKSMEEYTQTYGRAGRDGKESHCALFFSLKDRRKVMNVICQNLDHCDNTVLEHMNKVMLYCTNFIECRRTLQHLHFGQKFNQEYCGSMCDNCKGRKYNHEDYTDDAFQLLKFINDEKKSKLTLSRLVNKQKVDAEKAEMILHHLILQGYLKEKLQRKGKNIFTTLSVDLEKFKTFGKHERFTINVIWTKNIKRSRSELDGENEPVVESPQKILRVEDNNACITPIVTKPNCMDLQRLACIHRDGTLEFFKKCRNGSTEEKNVDKEKATLLVSKMIGACEYWRETFSEFDVIRLPEEEYIEKLYYDTTACLKVQLGSGKRHIVHKVPHEQWVKFKQGLPFQLD